MILVYVTNERIGEVADLVISLRENDRVSYRNPRYFRKPEKCDQVFIYGDFPDIAKAYGDKVISKVKKSTDHTIAELREIKPEMSDEEWEEFTKDDTRKSIDSI